MQNIHWYLEDGFKTLLFIQIMYEQADEICTAGSAAIIIAKL